jgi:hypothetical protein
MCSSKACRNVRAPCECPGGRCRQLISLAWPGKLRCILLSTCTHKHSHNSPVDRAPQPEVLAVQACALQGGPTGAAPFLIPLRSFLYLSHFPLLSRHLQHTTQGVGGNNSRQNELPCANSTAGGWQCRMESKPLLASSGHKTPACHTSSCSGFARCESRVPGVLTPPGKRWRPPCPA